MVRSEHRGVYAQGDRAEAELFCEADLLGMQFSIEGVSVFIHFIRVDHEGDESMCPK